MKTFGFKTKEEVLEVLENNRDIKFVRIIFPDVLGREMSFCIPSEEMKSAFESGEGFDGSSVEGFARIEESDLTIMPDPTTFRVLPWTYQTDELNWKEAVVFGEIFTSQGEHFAGDSRHCLKKTLEQTKGFGQLFCGPELEFFVFPDENTPQPLDHGGYFYGGKYGTLRKVVQLHLRAIGIETVCDHHEVSPSQHEINLKYSDALTMADSIVLAKYVTKRAAKKLDVFTSFMPKPIADMNGSGMHLHLSLWKDSKNLFFNTKENPLSDLAKGFIMGLIKYGKDIQVILNQWANSYKRLIPGYEAPVYLAWGRENRSAYIRVPGYQQGKEASTRIELRSPDPACNIYLALTVILKAGLQGIKEGLEFMPAQEKDIFAMQTPEIQENDIKTLSNDLGEATKCFQDSSLLKQILPPHLFEKIIQNKKIEYANYLKAINGKKEEHKKAISPYEIKEYLPTL